MHKTPRPTWPRVLLCSIACLPDKRHITSQRCGGTAIVDTDRVCAGHLDLHVWVADVHDVECCGSGIRSEASNGAPLVKAEPLLNDYGGIGRSRAFFACLADRQQLKF
jgi:hypothetical protein